MLSSKISPNIDHVEFKPAPFGAGNRDFLGRISFLLNGFIQFRRLPVFRDGDGLRIDLAGIDPTATGLPMVREDLRRAIERCLAEQMGDLIHDPA
jgi:hypothetical protein